MSIYVNDIEVKVKNNLSDDNVFSEDFIKDLLNICMGWNLINLNTDTQKFPGIDLGDKERHIGVQVTSTKTSKKVSDSLDTIVRKKQKNYSVDFARYDTLDCSESNIWDFSDIIMWCTHYDSVRMEKVWNVIKREIVIDDAQYIIPLGVKNSILELKNAVHKGFETANQLIQTRYTTETYLNEVNKSLGELEQILPYLDEKTYLACKEILEKGIELGKLLQLYHKWDWNINARCIYIMYKSSLEKNLQEVSELIENDISGLQKGIDIVIDGDNLFERLTELKIDKDILNKQFSVIKFQNVIEDNILRKSKKCIIFFSKDNKYYNEELVCRLEAEGTHVKVFESRLRTIEFMCEQIKKTFELVLISSSEDMVNREPLKKNDCYLYTISFENDLPTRFVPTFFLRGDITSRELNQCFNYNECKIINIKDITEDIYRDMLANANDCISHQLRVNWSGDVYISTITGAEEIDDVKFRWESWDAGNGYTGPRAASDYKYVKQSVATLKKCWKDEVRGYCDYYTIF